MPRRDLIASGRSRAGDTPLTVACTQEAALFSEVAAEGGRATPIEFADIRESAGWSSEAGKAGPKIAALLAAAAEPTPPVPLLSLESRGVVLICGRDDTAVEAGQLLKDHLDVTVLIEPPAAIAPRRTDFPVAKGKVRNASGHVGAFEVTVDDFAQATPSSRRELLFAASAQRHEVELRRHSGPDRRLAVLPGGRFARRLSARRSRPSRRDAAGRLKDRDLVGGFEKRATSTTTLRTAPIPARSAPDARAASTFVRRSRNCNSMLRELYSVLCRRQ